MATASLALLPIAVPEPKASAHPMFPHPHLGPSFATIVCPTSKAFPVVPLNNFPFITAPPPIPVLAVINTIFSVPFPAPNINSPSVATFASLSK